MSTPSPSVVSRADHPTMPAIEHVVYRMPRTDVAGQPTGELDARLFEKTIYDPEFLSDDAYIALGREAATDAKRNGELHREWSGVSSAGVRFRGYLDERGRVRYFFPEFPRTSAAPVTRLELAPEYFAAQAFFNAVPDFNFVAMALNLSQRVGHVVNAAGCLFPGNVASEPAFDGVQFWVQDDELCISDDEFQRLLRLACDAQCEQVPAHEAALRQLFERAH